MIKIFISFFILLISTVTANTPFVIVNAQEITPLVEDGASANKRWFCLSAPKGKAEAGMHNAELSLKEGATYGDLNQYPITVVVRIAGNMDIESAEEMTEENSEMTTGNSPLDIETLGGDAGLIALTDPNGAYGLQNAGLTDGINPRSTFPAIWHDDLSVTAENQEPRSHYWYGVQESPAVEDTGAGGAGALQNATFTFDNAGGAKDCDVIRWDPFGYVFDAITHGPVVGASVRILSSPTEGGVYAPVAVGVGKGMVGQNPIQTKKDGSYRFYVDPGYYKLEISKYSIEKDITKIKAGYDEFGYEQLYLAETPEVIHEQAGKVERRDIAIETIGAPAPFSAGPKLKDILVSRSMKNGAQAVRITGMVSQIPVDLIAVYKDVNNMVVGQERYSLTKDHKYVPTGLHDKRNFDIWVPAEAKSGVFKELKITSKYSGKVITVPIRPMPSYLNGVAQTKAGIPLVAGTVAIYPIGVNKPSYIVPTDNKGHFEIESDWIPLMPYELWYKSASGEVIVVTTSEYLRQNKVYHAEKKINSYAIQSAETDKTTNKKINKGVSSLSGRAEPTAAQKMGGISSSGMQGVLMIVATLIVLVIIGVGAFFTMRSKQQVPPQQI